MGLFDYCLLLNLGAAWGIWIVMLNSLFGTYYLPLSPLCVYGIYALALVVSLPACLPVYCRLPAVAFLLAVLSTCLPTYY
jgi:hypothetical protein